MDPAEPTQDELAQRALARGFITSEQLRVALTEQAGELAAGRQGRELPDILVEKGFITKSQLAGLFDEKGGATPSHAPLGKYEIIRELGRGGMGVVYQAVDTQLNRPVALKLLLAGAAPDVQEARLDEERFLREARLSANLPKHPHIVSVYEAGVLDGKRYLAMELIDGLPMAKWRKLGSTTIRQQVKILRDVALAVHHAHQKNVIHRDLKPDNILVDRQGEPHVTDFGLAKAVGENVRVSLTASGMIVGTPAYMSPEQAMGQKTLDHRTDVYAIGIMLYETLSGRLPFSGATAIEILMKAAKNPVPPFATFVKPGTNPTLDKAIEGVCFKALAKKPGERYPTAEALAQDLTRWLKGEEVRAPAPAATRRKAVPKKKPSTKVWIGAAAAVLALIVGYFLFSSSPEPERDASGPDTAELERKKELRKKIDRLLADARKRFDEGKPSEALGLYDEVLRLDHRNAAALEGKKEVRSKELDLELAKADALMTEGKYPEAMRAYSQIEGKDPSNRRATAGVEAAKAKMNEAIARAKEAVDKARTDEERKAAEKRRQDEEEKERNAKAQIEQEKARVQEAAARLRDSSVRTLSGHESAAWAVAVSPDGKTICSGSVDLTIRTWDGSTGVPIGRHQEGSGVFGLAWSRDGKLLASANVDQTVKLWDPLLSREPRVLRGHQKAVTRVVFSPDGSLLGSASQDGTARLWDVAKGTQLFSFEIQKGGSYPPPVFLSKGRVLAVGDGGNTIKFYDVKTGKEARPPLPHEGIAAMATNADGSLLATSGWDKRILIWDLIDSKPIRTWTAHPEGIWSIAFSPDGRSLASASVDCTVRIWEAQTGRLIDTLVGHTGGVYWLAFHPDGRTLASASGDATVKLWSVEGLAGEEAWKKSIDLLALVDPKRDSFRGPWRKEGGKLLSTPFPNGCLKLPYEPPEEYDFRMIFTRRDAKCASAQFFVHQGRTGIWDLGKGGIGFGDVGGKGPSNNPTFSGFGIQDNVRYVSIVQVRRDRARGWIDGQKQSEWLPLMGGFSTPLDWWPGEPGVLGIGNCDTTTTIEAIQVLEVTGKGKLRTTTAPPPEKPAAVAAPAAGLVAYWKLNEGSGASAGDSTGNKLSARLQGPVWNKGKAGGIRLDGVKQKMELPASPALEKLAEGSYTVSFWFKPDEAGPENGSQSDLLRLPWCSLYYLPKNHFMVQHILAGNVFGTAMAPDDTSPPGVYYHVAAVIDRPAGTTNLYINSVSRSFANWTPNSPAAQFWPGTWNVGAIAASEGNKPVAAKGTIDSIRLYNRALTEAEVQAQHKAELPVHDK